MWPARLYPWSNGVESGGHVLDGASDGDRIKVRESLLYELALRAMCCVVCERCGDDAAFDSD